MSKKKGFIIAIILLVIILLGIGVFIFIQNNKGANPTGCLNEYVSFIKEENYESMYSLITSESKETISEEDFITRHKNIYDGISMSDYNLEVTSEEKIDNGKYRLNYDVSMNTLAGEIKFSANSILIKNKETKKYELEWSSNFIYPSLDNTDKIKVKTTEASRGSILDRNGEVLAGEGDVSSVGLVPGKMSENKEEDIQRLSELLDVSVETINKSLNASYVKSDTFVPIKKVGAKEFGLKDKLLEIPGIKISTSKDRVYPLAEAASHLIGYIQNVTAEDLEKNPDKGYNQNSVVGKAGFEKQFEDRLRGTAGKEINIEDKDGVIKKTIASKEVQNGEDIILTIDAEIQSKLYEELKDDKGFFVVMNPKTGELLALVSTPSYDNNQFIYGMGTQKWNSIKEDERNPMYSRYTKNWCPGSTFKPVTAAIGLTSGKLTEEDTFSYDDLSWQKNSSWGDYKITTLTAYSGAKNIKNALIYSDNIFFAQAALKIGKEDFTKGLKNIGFEENLNLNLGLSQSKISNSGEIKTEIGLADSGYGQGEILVNPIHMASIYSAFVNDGNMIKPYIEYKDNVQVECLKENAFSEEAANIVKEDLIQVIENPEGTANDMKISGVSLAGKTGTAELKASKDEIAETLGWFNLITTDENSDKQYVIVSMVEDARDLGGSHYLIKKIRTLFE